MNTHIKIIGVQGIFLVLVIIALFIFYPRANVDVNGNFVRFNSINANVIVISENPDFSNPRYLSLNETKNVSLNLKSGTYYWKGDNGIIEGVKKEFVIQSEVAMEINKTENESDLVNVGNVKISVKKNQNAFEFGKKIVLVQNQIMK